MTGTHHLIFLVAFVTVIEGARDGGWSTWGRWSRCTATCGFSTQQRVRLCNDPPPSDGGHYCEGSPREKRPCDFVIECPVDGGWTGWSVWSECSKTCGKGVRRRQRTCTDPAPQGDGRDCAGAPEQRETCTVRRNCPRDGQWSMWSDWSECSVTCGDGTRLRYRSCNSPPPSNGGRPCRGLSDEVDNCRAPVNCPIDGHWSGWSAWSPCPVTCGVAEIQRVRSCDDPPPLFGGENCMGGSRETDVCDPGITCPVHGHWSEWSSYGPCLATNCHLRKYATFKQRSCNNPSPSHGGRMCEGSFLRAGMCIKPINCPINGGWSDWSEWKCSAEVAKRTRECDNPPPTNGGKPCPGDDTTSVFREEEPENFKRLCGKRLQIDDEDLQPGGSGSGQGPT